MFVFPNSRSDYFTHLPSSKSWKRELNQISSLPEGSILSLSEKGFEAAGLLYALWQKIKGFLGFNDETNEWKISGRILKILYIGASQKYIEDSRKELEAV